MKIAVICPSRNRVKMLEECVDSWKATTEGHSDFHVILDKDDEQNYPRIEGIDYRIVKRTQGTVELLNASVMPFVNDYDAVYVINDDMVFRTQAWDTVFINKTKEMNDWAILYANDLFQGIRCASQVFVTTNILKVFGFYAYPKLIHLWVDTWWQDIGTPTGRIKYVPEVIVEHIHPFAGKREPDKTCDEVNSQEFENHDRKVHGDWRKIDMWKDRAKLLKAYYKSTKDSS